MIDRIQELEKEARLLEPDFDTRTQIGLRTEEYINNFINDLPHQPGYRTGPLTTLESLCIEDTGKPFNELLAILKNEVDVWGINSASGKHMGYIPGGGIWMSAIGDFLAAATNRYTGIAYSCPGAVKIENQLIRWLCDMVGYTRQAYGNLTSGGSIANLAAIKAARDYHKINAGNVKKQVVYLTEYTHHCILKALDIVGLKEAIIRTIPVNGQLQMDTGQLQSALEEDTANGLLPFLVVASAGTTATGAVDPLDRIADLCDRFSAWFHIDAAYGGFFVLVPAIHQQFKGIERSDSVVLDPHKTLFMPYGSGVVLLKNGTQLIASHAYEASYMNESYHMEDISPSDTGIELTRHYRGLRMWLALHYHGLNTFKANLEEKLLLCRYFNQQVAKLGLQTGPEPQLSIALFRCKNDTANHLTRTLLKYLLQNGRVFFSSVEVNNELWIRCAVVCFRTHLADIEVALQVIGEMQVIVQ